MWSHPSEAEFIALQVASEVVQWAVAVHWPSVVVALLILLWCAWAFSAWYLTRPLKLTRGTERLVR